MKVICRSRQANNDGNCKLQRQMDCNEIQVEYINYRILWGNFTVLKKFKEGEEGSAGYYAMSSHRCRENDFENRTTTAVDILPLLFSLRSRLGAGVFGACIVACGGCVAALFVTNSNGIQVV